MFFRYEKVAGAPCVCAYVSPAGRPDECLGTEYLHRDTPAQRKAAEATLRRRIPANEARLRAERTA